MKRRYPHKQNILLVNITRLGDMLQATPTIAGMKMENPDCRISVLVEKQFESVCHWLPNIDDVYTIDLGMTVRSLALAGDHIIDAYEYVSELVESLRGQSFDYCLNMSSSGYTAMLLRMLGVEKHGGWTADAEGHRVIESDWAKLFASSVFHQNRQFNSINLVDVFRCSADVEEHPRRLLINIAEESRVHIQRMLAEQAFTNKGPLVCIQAGASQGKRQWSVESFAKLIKILVNEHDCRIVLSGAAKELSIIEPIQAACASPNVAVAAGKTNIPQLAALLELSDVLITGDTGPMHMSVAAGTPVISMFLASAYGFETGPYSEGNIVLQPVIRCGPCNPNKPCARPDCHECIEPEVLAELTIQRIRGDILKVPDSLANPSKVLVFRSYFDELGFCDLKPLNSDTYDGWGKFRRAYRNLWLEDLGGYNRGLNLQTRRNGWAVEGLEQVFACADKGVQLIDQLVALVRNPRSSAGALAALSQQLGDLDRMIEQTGFRYAPLGPLTRMFVFAKENLSGTDVLSLSTQTLENYNSLKRRAEMLDSFYRAND